MFNSTYDFVVGNAVVESVERAGRSEKVMSNILLDRAYKWAMEAHTDDIRVFDRESGKEYYYNV
ncbi:hypothetical protein [Paenibacillus sp. Marseille-Q4541]|uniref:hypothetical protein n=1 Tax=Paenibacillus sp. Marseille-Q4541 TaxID=2831522 RepID=UPI001BA6BCC1|nr:hypothetical protein [Paenibacillus sp. Marseille-Q4541]